MPLYICGLMPECERKAHMDNTCPLRPVPCSLGCGQVIAASKQAVRACRHASVGGCQRLVCASHSPCGNKPTHHMYNRLTKLDVSTEKPNAHLDAVPWCWRRIDGIMRNITVVFGPFCWVCWIGVWQFVFCMTPGLHAYLSLCLCTCCSNA